MLKKTLFFANKCAITTANEQLVITSDSINRTIPIEDIGYVVIDHNEVYISIPALNKLINNNCACIICDDKHLPNGMLLNLNSHHIQQEIFKYQIAASLPLKNNCGNRPSRKKSEIKAFY
ncbi:CRISPR-associated endonuclease Cas1 [Gelidibacter maritimus]|uniref:CRISPR-associated endonuclease Cas1 n=1 Tax=Gelidibacter maritimus TaxID=2761487 RepID=UPI0021D09288|nr:CRISPR-associated endonuclease Cas1 [Gelidibacter maritimus]